jgi:hypothetical protein
MDVLGRSPRRPSETCQHIMRSPTHALVGNGGRYPEVRPNIVNVLGDDESPIYAGFFTKAHIWGSKGEARAAPEVILAPGSAAAGPLLQGDRQRAAARVTIRRRSLKNNGLWRMMTASTCSLASLGNAISRSLGTSASTETMPIDSFKPAASTSRRGG